MALTYTRAPTVAKGQRITSQQYRLLARAFNDRLRAGPGNPAWRLAHLHFNAWRQIRNPASNGLVFPPQGEFFDIYQHFEPEHALGTTWPVQGPGEFEGLNLANVMAQFEFGVDPTLDREDVRLNDPNLLRPFGVPETLEDWWETGKYQRGVYDPISGAQNTPALELAQEFFKVQTPLWSPHGKSYGGYFPTPILLDSDCGTLESTGLGVPSYAIKFTSLGPDVSTAGLHGTITQDGDGNQVVTYAGSCPCWTEDHAAGHVMAVMAFPFAFYVLVGTGSGCGFNVDRLDIKEWIEGPYTGEGRLTKADGNQLDRFVQAFVTDFRGTPAQRTPDDFEIEEIAFDFQKFFSQQYALAPNKATVDGTGLLAEYPRVTFSGSGTVPQGTLGTFAQGGTSHAYAPGFVLAGAWAKGVNLLDPCVIELVDGGTVIGTIAIDPDRNEAQAMRWFKTALVPAQLEVRLGTDARFTGAGSITVEVTEQVDYKPEVWDAYLVTRLSASSGGDGYESGVDGRGKDTSFADLISDDYFDFGAIVNRQSGSVRDSHEWINDKPVYDTARRLTKSQVRVVRRQNFVKYEVPGDGTCVLYFKRFAYGLDGLRADMFDGIGPSLDPVSSGDLVVGEEYIVRVVGDGFIEHDHQTVRHNERIVARRKDFTTHGSGSVYVLQYDGIRHTALKKGFSNEWVMFLETKCYHPSASSIWKPEAYSDYFAWCQRCHFYSATAPATLRRHMAYNHTTSLDAEFQPTLNDMAVQAIMLSPEAPDALNYAENANRTYNTEEFCASCQIYEAPYEIQSCTVEDWASDQVLKVVFTKRLRAHPDAPATVNADPTTWSTDEIDILRNAYTTDPNVNEDYRTPDNAVREYALHQADGSKQCTFKEGDAGTGSGVQSLPDNPFGSCYPHFFFVHLIPEPFEDSNNVAQSHDARCVVDGFVQMELALRSMCEGFIDSETSQDIICATGLGNLYDFKYPNLCFQAFGGRGIGLIGEAVRDDGPSGYGPLPNTLMYHDVFNRLAQAVNLLNRARVDLPIQFRQRTHAYTGSVGVSLDGNAPTCSATSLVAAWGDGLVAPGAGTKISVGSWIDFIPSITAFQSVNLDGCPFALVTNRQDIEYVVEIDPDFANALPAEIQELFDLGRTGFLVEETLFETDEKRNTTETSSEGQTCEGGDPGHFFESGSPTQYMFWDPNRDTEVTGCKIVLSGVLSASLPGPADYFIGRDTGMGSGTYCRNGADRSVTYELIAEQGAFVEVEVVDAV